MKKQILIINGPNLNLLGKREVNIYGDVSFETYFKKLQTTFPHINLEYYQSNVEGLLIDKIQEANSKFSGVILNAGAYTHTSIALADAIASIQIPVIEVHISNVYKREFFRHNSYLSPYCQGIIVGAGLLGYKLALFCLLENR